MLLQDLRAGYVVLVLIYEGVWTLFIDNMPSTLGRLTTISSVSFAFLVLAFLQLAMFRNRMILQPTNFDWPPFAVGVAPPLDMAALQSDEDRAPGAAV